MRITRRIVLWKQKIEWFIKKTQGRMAEDDFWIKIET